MKNKNIEVSDVNEICENYCEIINQLYSANYLLLNDLSKSKSSESIAKKGWLGKVTENPSKIRNKYFLKQGKMLIDIREQVYQLFTESKTKLVEVFNKYYRKNAKFEDYFNGTEVRDYKYAQDSFDFCRDELSSGDYMEFTELLIAHSNFNNQVENLMKYEALVEIFNELSRYSSRTGKRIWTFGFDKKPKNLGLINDNEILKLCVDIGDCHLALMHEAEITGDFSSLSRRQSLEQNALEIVQNLQNRLVAANTPFDKKAHKETQRMVDVVASIKNIATQKTTEYDKVNYNKNEIILLKQALNEMCCDELFESILKERGTFELVENLLLRAGGQPEVNYNKLDDVSSVDQYYLDSISNSYREM